MGAARLIRRTAPLILVGLAGAAAARRRGERMRQAALTPPPYPPPVARAEPVIEVEPEPPEPEPEPPEPEAAEPEPEPEQPEPEPEPEEPEPAEREPEPTSMAPWLRAEEGGDEQATAEAPQTVEASSVTEIVDDLLAPGESADLIEDATIVEGGIEEDQAPAADDALAAAVRGALAEQPGLLPGTVDIEVEDGAVRLSGEVERVETITELERRTGEVPGVRSVRSFLHLPGTPPPAAGEQR